jgi:hypothetical protein
LINIFGWSGSIGQKWMPQQNGVVAVWTGRYHVDGNTGHLLDTLQVKPGLNR